MLIFLSKDSENVSGLSARRVPHYFPELFSMVNSQFRGRLTVTPLIFFKSDDRLMVHTMYRHCIAYAV